MSTADRFKFIKELELQNANQNILMSKQPQQYSEESQLGKLVYCHFSQVKEQTQNEVEKPFKDTNDYQSTQLLPKRDQRCYFKDKNLRIYSRGGSEFIITLLFDIIDVYSIEDGLIIKTEYNRDLIHFDPFQIKAQNSKESLPQYSYMTVTGHPLNDIHPLSFGDNNTDMIQTYLDIIHVSYKMPFVVLFDRKNFKIKFGLIKNKNLQNIEQDEDNDAYIRSIEPMSRHPEIYNISKDSKLIIEELYSFSSPNAPSFVGITSGMYNTYELNVYLYSKQTQALDFYSCDIRQLKEWKNSFTLSKIENVCMLSFSRQNQQSSQSVKLISQQVAKQLTTQIEGLDINFISNTYQNNQRIISTLKKRLKCYHKDLMVLDSHNKVLNFYQGSLQIYQIDLNQLFSSNSTISEKSISIQDREILSKQQIVSFKCPSKSNVTLVFSNKDERRLAFRLQINDFLVQSMFKIFRKFFNQNLYENLYKDFIESITRQAQEYKQNPNQQIDLDPFSRLSTLIIQILQSDQYKGQQQVSQTIPQQNTNQSLNSSIISQQSSNTNKPNQTLHTKILRSSTTSFNEGGMATRRKTAQLSQAQQMQVQQTHLQQQQQQIQQQLQRGSNTGKYGQTSQGQVTRQSMPIGHKTGQARRTGIGITETSQPFSFAPSAQTPAHQVTNPFQELLSSDFHKNNFASQYSNLFPSDFIIKPPVILQSQQVDEKPTQVSVSPTKSTGNKSSSHKISSIKQSSTFHHSQHGHHERKNSNLIGNSNSNQMQTQMSTLSSSQQQTFSSTASQLQHQPVTIAVHLWTHFKTQKQDLMKHINLIFDSLHLLYEDLKLNNLRDKVYSHKLARLLIQLAVIIDPYQKAAYIEYYFKEHQQQLSDLDQDIKKYYKDGSLLRNDIEIEPVPKIFKWIENQIKGSKGLLSFSFPLLFENTRKIVRLYELLSGSQKNSILHSFLISQSHQNNIDHEILQNSIIKLGQGKDNYQSIMAQDYLMNHQLKDLHQFEKILFCLKDESMNLDELKKLPSIVALPILEIIRYARLFQSEVQSLPVWPDSLYKLIQREDILNNLRLFERNTTKNNQFGNPISMGLNNHIQETVQRQPSKKYALNRAMTNVFNDNTLEELKQEEHRKEMQSNIVRTTADLIYNQGDQIAGVTDISNKNTSIGDFFKNRFSQDTRLKEVQNMLNSSTEIIVKLEHIQNRETLTEEVFNQEKQKLLDKMFLRQLAKCTGRGGLTFGTMQTIPTEVLHIPKINQTGYAPMNETYMQIEFKDEAAQKEMLQWPEFHNGVASALRIAQSFKRDFKDTSGVSTQHTRNWIMYHKPQEPKYEHGGFLLAIGLLGQLDTLQPTDIYQHLKSTHDATAIGVLLGRSASKIGTMDDHDTRTLCIHIPYLLPPTLSIDISLSIQSAAVIGAGLLYKGTSNRLMTEMLLAQIGRKPLSDKAIEREGYALASGLALGLVNLGVGNKMQGLSDLKLDERLIRYVEGGKIIDLPQSMLSQNFNHENSMKSGQGCSSIKEGDMVNVHITSQGALVALALIYLKSNNHQIVNQLQMPQTFYQLESVRPAFLLVKTLCRNLIMWDQIQCTKEWVISQVPQLIRDIYENDIQTVLKRTQQKTVIEDGIDFSTVALCYVNIVAGAIFSIGFKYVGTGNKMAFQLINEYTLHFFRKLKIIQSNKDSIGVIHNNFTKNQVDKNTVETCLCVCAFSMSMIMAGTGDVDCFKSLRILRKRFENDMHYGYNMAIHMSLGFLFLGTGAFTFSSNDLSIAALLCSLYPMFPQNPNDNRYHLQALRHFYVLAIETRLLQARDIDTGEFLQINMDVTVEESNQNGQVEIKTQKITTPDIINGIIKQIEIFNDQYHNITIDNLGSSTQNLTQQISNSLDLKKSKVFEQFGFQRVIYLKKKTLNSIDQFSKDDSTVAADQIIESQSLINKELYEKLHSMDSFSRELVEQVGLIYGKVSQIKDPSIEAFKQQFGNIELLNHTLSLQELDDVLLSSSKDQYGQINPSTYFLVQDTSDLIRELYFNKQIPDNARNKIQTLRVLHDSYFNDNVDLIKVMIDCLHKLNNAGQRSILTAYLQFKTGLKQYNKTNKHSILQDTCKQNNITSYQEQISQSVNRITQFQFINKAFGQNDQVDLYIAQICKQICDQILNELNMMGEIELTSRYKHKKINGLSLEDGPLIEINESLKMSIQALISENSNFDSGNKSTDQLDLHYQSLFIDKILLPVVLRF